MNDFEAADYFLLPHDPIYKNMLSGVKRGVSEISYATGVDISYA